MKELKTERLDNAGLVETLEFELQLKKRELEQALVPSDQQREELRILAKDFHRMRNNKDVIDRNIVTLEEGDKKEIERWRDAWFEVDKLLDNVARLTATERMAEAAGNEEIDPGPDAENRRKPRHVEEKDARTGRE
ncbi:uncharacterized protein J4E79_005298 [Alternaria viburni]|uniref:uncharacterized protein n=1 Tax=Alternaria viburni TaxID=566460 RepID=UPI0020C52791|nr:uncharacterized protein J4E79_005298 [Alternaria viburni]KAI4660730.1 hypothetical protein J4E79_005298 [Alternaria viburni]